MKEAKRNNLGIVKLVKVKENGMKEKTAKEYT